MMITIEMLIIKLIYSLFISILIITDKELLFNPVIDQ